MAPDFFVVPYIQLALASKTRGIYSFPFLFPFGAPSFGASRLCGSHQMCFLDVVSINQADPELMQRGIYGLGGLSYALLCSLAPFTLRMHHQGQGMCSTV